MAPAELEALLLTCPTVGDAAVVGVPDEEAGELPKAFVVPKAGVDFSEKDVIEFLHSEKSIRQFLSVLYCPFAFFVFSANPVTSTDSFYETEIVYKQASTCLSRVFIFSSLLCTSLPTYLISYQRTEKRNMIKS